MCIPAVFRSHSPPLLRYSAFVLRSEDFTASPLKSLRMRWRAAACVVAVCFITPVCGSRGHVVGTSWARRGHVCGHVVGTSWVRRGHVVGTSAGTSAGTSWACRGHDYNVVRSSPARCCLWLWIIHVGVPLPARQVKLGHYCWLAGWPSSSSGHCRPDKSTGFPSRLLSFFNPIYRSNGWWNIATGFETVTFLVFNLFSDFYLFFVWIHCLIIGSLQPVTKYMLFDN